MDELIIISEEFNISLDEILNFRECANYKASFNTGLLFVTDPRVELVRTFQSIIDIYKKIKQSPNAKVLVASNVIPYQFFLKYKELAKIPSYRWLYQTQSPNKAIPFSEFKVTEEILALTEEFVQISNAVDTDFIFDKDTFASYVEDIAFFIKLNSITDAEIRSLKKDLLNLIDNLESQSATGYLTATNKISVYISNISIRSTYALFEADNFQTAHFRIYNISAIFTANPEVCKAHKMWISSLKRYSTLITQSADLVRAEYFNQQRELINRCL